MLDDAAKALGQMLSPPLRAVLWKSIGLALALIVVVAIVLDRLIVWLLGAGTASLETGVGPHAHTPATALAWLLSFAAGFGIIVGSIFLMPAVTAFVGKLLCRPDRRRSRARALSGRSARHRVAALACRCPKAARPRCSRSSSTFAPCRFCCSPASAPCCSFWPRLGCSGANISSLPPCAFGRRRRRRRCASAMRHGLCRWPADRRLRLDPGGQSGDAAVRHEPDGPRA